MTLAVGTFVILQRRGLFAAVARPIARFAGKGLLSELTAGAERLDTKIGEFYARGRSLRAALGLHFLGWVAGTGEVWIALYFLDHPVPLLTAMLLESLGQAVRAGAFVVPGALGVQEGAYILLGRALGIPPDTALALSLSKRCREMVLGLPGLMVWQFEEAKGLLAGSPGSDKEVESQ